LFIEHEPARRWGANDLESCTGAKSGSEARSVPGAPYADIARAGFVVAKESSPAERSEEASVVPGTAISVDRGDEVERGDAHYSVAGRSKRRVPKDIN
jgi:hypothetical protein